MQLHKRNAIQMQKKKNNAMQCHSNARNGNAKSDAE
jgi:hypothetical protein